MNVGENIYRYRKELGLSQKEFADKIGVSQAAINYWENGKRQPRLDQLRKISETLNITLNVFLDGCWSEYSDEAKNNFENSMVDHEKLNNLVSQYDKLNESGQSKAIEQVAMLTKIPEYQKQSEENSNYLLNAAHELTEIKKYTEKEAPDSESDQ